MSTDGQSGYVLGSIYVPGSDSYKLPEQTADGKALSDKTRVLELKDDTVLSVKIGETTMVIDKDKATVNGKDIKMSGNVSIEGNAVVNGLLTVEKNIVGKAEVRDNYGTLKNLRDIYNKHQNIGNLGAPSPISPDAIVLPD